MTKNKAIVLLSGGLDSLVSVAALVGTTEIKKALYFDYGQTSRIKEKDACEKICAHYGIGLETVKLSWLADISKKSALSESNTTTNNNETKSFWIPNRNGVFVNIGAAYAESLGCKYVIIGANKEEAVSFKDNSAEFIQNASKLFATSTENNVEILAPFIEMNKKEIIETAIKKKAPLELVWSCYFAGEKNCGKCPSCKLLRSALMENKLKDLQNILF